MSIINAIKNNISSVSKIISQKIDKWNLIVKYLVCFAVLLAACSQAQDTRSVSMTGYNYTDRTIHYYSVNGAMGSNLFVDGGGGSFSCCSVVTVDKPVKVDWIYSRTEEQYNACIPNESRSATVIVPPPQTPDAQFLEVHFYPDEHVELALTSFPTKHRRIPYVEKDE